MEPRVTENVCLCVSLKREGGAFDTSETTKNQKRMGSQVSSKYLVLTALFLQLLISNILTLLQNYFLYSPTRQVLTQR
jgi:hypothetical protein